MQGSVYDAVGALTLKNEEKINKYLHRAVGRSENLGMPVVIRWA